MMTASPVWSSTCSRSLACVSGVAPSAPRASDCVTPRIGWTPGPGLHSTQSRCAGGLSSPNGAAYDEGDMGVGPTTQIQASHAHSSGQRRGRGRNAPASVGAVADSGLKVRRVRQQVGPPDDTGPVQRGRAREVTSDAGQRREWWFLVRDVVNDQPHLEGPGELIADRRIDEPPVAHARDVLAGGRVLIVEIEGTGVQPLPVPLEPTVAIVHIDHALAMRGGEGRPQFPYQAVRAGGAALLQELVGIQPVRAQLEPAPPTRHTHAPVRTERDAREVQQTRVDEAILEARDLMRRVARELRTGRVVRVVRGVVTGIQELDQVQLLDRVREVDLDKVDRQIQARNKARTQYDSVGPRLRGLAGEALVNRGEGLRGGS